MHAKAGFGAKSHFRIAGACACGALKGPGARLLFSAALCAGESRLRSYPQAKTWRPHSFQLHPTNNSSPATLFQAISIFLYILFLILFAHTYIHTHDLINVIISITNTQYLAAQSTPNRSPACCATHLDFAELHPFVTISPNQAIRRLDCQIRAQSRSPVRLFPLPPFISGSRKPRRRVLCSASSPSWSSHDHAAQQPPGFRSPASPDSLCP